MAIPPIFRPTLSPTYAPTSGEGGLPWSARGGVVIVPPTVTISGAVSVGGTMTITATGTPTPTLTLYRDGVSAGTVTSPYTYVGSATSSGDIGPALTVVANNGVPITSNTLRYDITADTNATEALDTSTPAVGAVASWAGLKSVATWTQATAGKKPTQSATSFNGHPGITFAGGQVLASTGLAASYSSKGGMTLLYGWIDASTSTEYLFNCDGGTSDINIVHNDSGGAGNFEGLGSGTGWKSAAEAFSSVRVVGAGFDRSIDRVISYLNVDGVDQSLTLRGSPVTPGGNFGFTTFYIGGSGATPAAGVNGTLGCVVFASSLLSSSSNAFKTLAAWIAYKMGR